MGSNIGYYTTLLAAMVGPGGHVHAFEPNPAIVGNLRDSIEVNYLTNVTLREAALTDRVGEVTFYQPARRFGSGNLCGAGLPDDDLQPITVPALTLDTVFTGDEGPVRLLHMDVETAEPQVVAGGHAFIERQRDMVIVFEVIGTHFRRTKDDSAARMLAYFEVRPAATCSASTPSTAPSPRPPISSWDSTSPTRSRSPSTWSARRRRSAYQSRAASRAARA